MDMMHLPIVWYWVDFSHIGGVTRTAFLCLVFCLAMVIVCWRQIINDPDSN